MGWGGIQPPLHLSLLRRPIYKDLKRRPPSYYIRFICSERGNKVLRIPASYILKIALADAIGQPDLPAVIKFTGREMMAPFLNDNTSPETHSFHPVRQNNRMSVGSALAIETLMRYLPGMPLYMLCRLRHYRDMGFSGYEARYFSLFENLVDDMGAAADLQVPITLLAYKYILERKVCHQSIPDNPTVESERRQFFFGSAIGIPTFYVHKNSTNRR
jgi:hypothetical protein